MSVSFVSTLLESSGNVGKNCKVAVDSQGVRHYVYVKDISIPKSVYYKKDDPAGSPSTPVLIQTEGEVTDTNIAIDSSDDIHLAWTRSGFGYATAKVYYVKITNGTVGSIESVASPASAAYVSIAVNSLGDPLIAFAGDTQRLSTSTPGASPTVVQIPINESGHHNDIIYDSNDDIHMVSTNFSSGDVYYKLNSDPHVIIDTTATFNGESGTSIDISYAGGNVTPKISFHDNNGAAEKLRFVSGDGAGGFLPAITADNGPGSGENTSIKVDSLNRVNIVYSLGDGIRFIRDDGLGNFYPKVTFLSSSYGSYLDMDLGSNDEITIITYRSVGGDLYRVLGEESTIIDYVNPATITETSVDIKGMTDADGTMYFVAIPAGDTAPTPAQIKAGNDSSNSPVAVGLSGSYLFTSGVENPDDTLKAINLTPGTNYDIYIISESTLGPTLHETPTLLEVETILIVATLTQDYNLIHNVETEYEGTTTQPNNIDLTNSPGNTDPKYKTPGSNFRLTSTSPGIDAAAPSGVHADIPDDDIVGVSRESDIGAYEFIPANVEPPIAEPAIPVVETVDVEPEKEGINFFDYLTTFWNYLTEGDRDLFRNYWSGASKTGDYLWKHAGRMFDSINPEQARTVVTDEYYDMQIGPFYSKPINLDPTLREPNNVIRPLNLSLVEPAYVDEEPVYRDLIEINKVDYDKIRTVGLDTYAVLSAKNEDIEDQYFKVFNLLSSEEAKGRYSSAEIDETLTDLDSDDLARILVEGNTLGVEENTVLVQDVGTSPAQVTWTTNTVEINVRTSIESGTSDGTSVAGFTLIDLTQDFLTTVRVGDEVENTTTGEVSYVANISSDIVLNLWPNDIFQVVSQDYVIRPVKVIDSGTTDSELDMHLVDSTQDFTVTVKAGDTAHNVETGESSLVASVVSDTDIEVSDSGFIASGARYEIIPQNSINQVEEFLAAATTPVNPGDKWAEFEDRSGYNSTTRFRKTTMPTYTVPVELDDMTNFIFEEQASGRYYPTVGQSWEWYEGYSLENGTVGELEYGRYVPDLSKAKYITVLDGDISYLKDEAFTFHLTTNRSYDINNIILDVPTIQSFITDGNEPEFKKGSDYTFDNNIVEFNRDPFEIGDFSNGDYLYSRKADSIEEYIFSNYGTVVDNPDWDNYNYDNTSGKAAISGLMKALQNSSNKEEYERALNIYYGLPIAPQDSKVTGLYESYGYEITAISANEVTISLKDDEPMHNFIQVNTRLFSDGNKDVKVSTILDRDNGIIEVDDASSLTVGTLLYTKLRNRWNIKRVVGEGDGSPEDPAYIEIFSPEGDGAIKHVIDVVNTLSKSEASDAEGITYPEILVYGTEDLEEGGFNGIYHITDALALNSSVTRLTIYKASDFTNPLYNDYIGETAPMDEGIILKAGFVHMPWPTHKFLNILMNGEKYFKAYLDAPIDTIYDDEDELKKYQIIARNVSAINSTEFPNWNEFNQFKKFHGLSNQSNMLELTKTIPGASFGEYFPSRYEDISE